MPTRYNPAMLRKWLFLLAAGAIGATLSVWLFDDWVWGHLFNYSHWHGERLKSLSITAFVGLLTGFGFAWAVRQMRRRKRRA
jgi:hypothetical protein